MFANRAAGHPRLVDRTALARLMGYSAWLRVPDTYDADVWTADGGIAIRVVPVADRWGARAGRLIVTRFIPRESLPAAAAAGDEAPLLPICAGCHRVRTELGRWMHAEAYRSPVRQVEFTHGLCEDCLVRLYPELSVAG